MQSGGGDLRIQRNTFHRFFVSAGMARETNLRSAGTGRCNEAIWCDRMLEAIKNQNLELFNYLIGQSPFDHLEYFLHYSDTKEPRLTQADIDSLSKFARPPSRYHLPRYHIPLSDWRYPLDLDAVDRSELPLLVFERGYYPALPKGPRDKPRFRPSAP